MIVWDNRFRRWLLLSDGFAEFYSSSELDLQRCTRFVVVLSRLGALKGDGDDALRTQVVDFIRLRFLHDACEVAAVSKVAVMQLEAGVVHIRILVMWSTRWLLNELARYLIPCTM